MVLKRNLLKVLLINPVFTNYHKCADNFKKDISVIF